MTSTSLCAAANAARVGAKSRRAGRAATLSSRGITSPGDVAASVSGRARGGKRVGWLRADATPRAEAISDPSGVV